MGRRKTELLDSPAGEIYAELCEYAKERGAVPNAYGFWRWLTSHLGSPMKYGKYRYYWNLLIEADLIRIEPISKAFQIVALQIVDRDPPRHRTEGIQSLLEAVSLQDVPSVVPVTTRKRWPKSLKRGMYKSQKGRCWWCGCELQGVYHIDHRVPLAKGGEDKEENLCLACPECNQRKGAKLPHEFNGRLL